MTLRPLATLTCCALGLVACTSPGDHARPRPPQGVAPAASRAPALGNVHRLTDGVLSGAAPEGDAGFAELVRRGVRTVISVDGAAPDVERARAHGLRYVHVPVTYADVTDAQRVELARAIRDLPGPVYIHCHHGKHRSPAAAAAAGVALGLVTPEQGLTFMREAGTSPSYPGLYACVSAAHLATPIELDAAPSDFPSVRRPAGLVAAMVEVDEALEHLDAIRAAGWTPPADHPDLVPAAEAGRLADDLRAGGEDTDARARGDDFSRRLAEAVERASALEEALVAGAPPAGLEPRLGRLRAACTECHAKYRDQR